MLQQVALAIAILLWILLAAMPANAQFRSLENPSFEANDPAGPGAPNYEIFPSSSVPGWDTTTNEIELWDSTFNGVPAYAGLVFAEMNANVNGTFYQNICLVNGEPIGWTFAHRARAGGAATQTVSFQVATSGGTVLQTLATQNSLTSNQVWNVNSGSRTYTGATGMQRVQFTTTNPGSYGNFLDAVQLTLRPFIQLSAASTSGLESVPSTGIASLRITGATTSAISVTVNITGGTAVRGTDYTTPGGGASFTVTVPAGTYNNTAVPLGITINDDSAVESSETITFSLAAGTGYTLGNTTTCAGAVQTTGTYTILDNDARLTLRKQWVGAVVGDDAAITVARGATVIDALTSDAGTANELDSDTSPTAVVIGETVTIAETLLVTNGGRYSGVITCTGTADTNLTNGLTIGAGETAIVCTYTNSRNVPLQVSKTSLIWSNGGNGAAPLAIPGVVVRYCITVTNPGTLPATQVYANDLLPATLSFVPGTLRSGSACNAATNIEDEDASGADEIDPYGISISGATLRGYAASLPAGGTFAMTFDASVH